jgi:alanyl-tRNA synthetase
MEKEDIKKLILAKLDRFPNPLIPYKSLKILGFSRYKCKSCGKGFWSTTKRDLCGDVDCLGDYTIYEKKFTSIKLSYTEIWKRFAKIFKEFGHTEIKRYPVVARWRDDIYFVEAAIDDFAPYVISGEVEAPANPLVIPQICLRFNDINNVGLSGRHLTSFVMAEQATFNTQKKKTYFDEEAIKYIFAWLTKGLGIDKNDLTFIEDAWVGAGYAGNSLEFFAGGIELGNQVYMRYALGENGVRDLETKTIDMGAGLERWAWLSNETPTVYEAIFPKTIAFIEKKVGINYDDDTLKKIYKFLGNSDFEKTSLNQILSKLSEETGTPIDKVKQIVSDMQAIYAIADHTRTLLVSIHDGALPSNVGGGYNLRNILRRSLAFIQKKGWNLDLNDVINEHKKEFGSWFKELNDFDISKIINREVERYNEFQQRNRKLIDTLINKGKISTDEMRELYESKGITIDDLRSSAEMVGKIISLPEEFYTTINKKERHWHKMKTKDIKGLKETEKLFYDEDLIESSGRIIKVIDGNKLILDKTIFYPEMGGQKPDNGTIDGINVVNVEIENNVIIHYLEKKIEGSVGSIVKMKIDPIRRDLLRKHHTATHIINQACRRILGEYVYQNGAEKDVDKAHLDITYYDRLSREQVNEIENLANETVAKNLKISVKLMDRTDAETRYGMSIYQGGAIPSAKLRIVSIAGYDVEACGGLHCNNTGEVNLIKIIKSERIQDGVVRLTFMADKPAIKEIQKIDGIVKDLMGLWGVKEEEVYKTAERFFSEAKTYKELYKSSEQGRIHSLLEAAKDDTITQIQTKLNDLGLIISCLTSAKNKKIIVYGDDIGVGYPNTEEIKAKLTERYKNVGIKGEFLFAHK